MAYRNYINLLPSDKGRRIYRVIPFHRLVEMFANKQNTLSKPRLWNDPFENFILQSTAITKDGLHVEYGMRDSFYGQCWTVVKESDAMWRIYSQDTNGVKITTTIRRLFESLYKAVPTEKRDLSCLIGRVKYLSQKAIARYLGKPISLDSTGVGIAETLLIKRKAFSHEKEVRLLFWADNDEAKSEVFAYSLDPYSLIEEIVFDSRLNMQLYRIFREYLKRTLGFKGRIIQSGLYKPPRRIFTKV
jgi:hypothetical protein